MEAALTQNTTTQLQDSTDNTNTDDQTGTFVGPNGTPVSSSLGTARTAFMKAGGRKHTLQIDKESSTIT
ncbi:hypothetical protein [Sporomusa sp.]|uniref:hypothetical protein n=1 Tax=Sporomusa sp. TaxID=2078658 RepID=UPI002BBF27FB|nr:hypothetical protein [Sporomusa sp.]HWR43240.1 hypothetical protein [Sporomusa sp.]